jgi:Grx4 family monothiol glutaredoxin
MQQTEAKRGVKIPGDAAEAEALLQAAATTCVVNFFATWAEPCAMCNAAFAELAAEHAHLSFVQLDADSFPDLCERYNLESVPAFLFVHGGKLIDSVTGADVPALVNKVKQHDLTASIAQADVDISDGTAKSAADAPPPLDERLQTLTHKAPVVLFMKGTPDAPQCGFSRTAVELLQGAKVTFDTFDILSDEEVRQGLKKYSNWPTYPQLYGDGKLVGGLDIMKELNEEGELADSLPAAAKAG